MKEVVTYSEAFKRGVVEKISQRVYNSLREAARKNGNSAVSVVKWVKKIRAGRYPAKTCEGVNYERG